MVVFSGGSRVLLGTGCMDAAMWAWQHVYACANLFHSARAGSEGREVPSQIILSIIELDSKGVPLHPWVPLACV